jgi:hypothetical protein
LPADLNQLVSLNILGNQLASFNLPAGLTNLTALTLTGNHLTTLTLPPDMTQLTSLVLDGNPLTSLVLSEPLAATNLAETVASLRSQGISVITYPLAVRLISPRRSLNGTFAFTLVGPPGVYTVLGSVDLRTWSELGQATNKIGSIDFTDVAAHLSQQKYYRVRLP